MVKWLFVPLSQGESHYWGVPVQKSDITRTQRLGDIGDLETLKRAPLMGPNEVTHKSYTSVLGESKPSKLHIPFLGTCFCENAKIIQNTVDGR